MRLRVRSPLITAGVQHGCRTLAPEEALVAISQELAGVQAFREHAEQAVFVEGSALYGEHLAHEMGSLSFAAWRASRLVVDTGVHALGWSRAQAGQLLLEHTALAPENIRNEVDRCIAWPGQPGRRDR